MKRLLIVLAACAVLAMALPAMSHASDTVRLTYSTFFPATNPQGALAEEWCKEVAKRTEGRVVVDFYPGQTLTKAAQCYDGVVEGISDVGFSCLAYSKGRFPVMAAVDLPLGYETGVQATRVANEVQEHFKPAEFDDVAVMYFHGHGPGLLFTVSKPVHKLEDLAGLKIRSTGNSAELVKALGGTPVAKSMSENYQLLQKGVVDGSMHPIESNKSFNLGEVCKYGTDSFNVAYTTVFFVVMNKDKWASISPEDQQIITGINKEWAVKHGQSWDATDVAGRQFLLDQGGEIIALDDAEAARWKTAAQPVLDDYVAKMKEAGMDGQAIVDFAVQALQDK